MKNEAMQHTEKCGDVMCIGCNAAHKCNTQQQTGSHDGHNQKVHALSNNCNTLQHTATHRNSSQHGATHCNMMQHVMGRDQMAPNTE